jgi:hypothetical protein
MTEQEIKFKNSIIRKINEYSIPVTFKEALSKYQNKFTEIKYNDNTKEVIDIGIEWFLCSKSPAYFIDNYCYISVPNLGIIPFKLYYFQKNILNELPIYKKYVTLKTRQCGISTATAFYCLWRALFRTSESIAIVSKNLKAAQDFVFKMKVTLDMLPSFLNLKLETDNKSSLIFANKSEIRSEARSPNAGRSSTLSLLVLDEAAFYGSESMVRQIVASAQPTLTRTGGSMILVSTPNGSSNQGAYYYEQIQKLKLSGNTKTEKLVEIDWYEVPDIKGIYPQKGYNSILQEYIELDYFNNNNLRKQMKNYFKPIENNWKENDWLKAQHNTLGDTLFRQEILHDFVVMGNSVFGAEVIDRVRRKIKDPISVDKIGNNVLKGLWIWKYPEPKRRYILSVDPAKGTSNDSSCIQILDAENYEQVAEYLGFCSTPEFSRIIKKVARYYNQGYVIIESNGIGEAVFNGVYNDAQDPYSNVYKQKITRNGLTIMTGWTTTVQTRQLITNKLIDWFNVDELWEEFKIYSSRLYAQMETWIWGAAGKPEHSVNCHDDTLMALAIGLYNRDKAINSGESFLVTEDGRTLDYSVNDELTLENNKGNSWDFVTSNDESEVEKFQEDYGVSIDQYSWLIGNDK